MSSMIHALTNSMKMILGLELSLYRNQWSLFFIFKGVIQRAVRSKVECCDAILLLAVAIGHIRVLFLLVMLARDKGL